MKNIKVNIIAIMIATLTIISISTYMRVELFAKNTDDTILKEAYLKMEKANFKNNTYGWEKHYFASNPEISDGVLGGKISDFDGDGEQELLVLKITGLNENNEGITTYGNANLEMYENINSSAQLVDSTDYVTLINSTTDAGGMEFLTKDKYIALQCAIQNNTFADGATQSINVYSYNGKEFVTEISKNFSASALYIDADDNLNSLFRKVGFNKTAECFVPDTIVDPYFTSECGLNLAKIEDSVELISEILITNNRDEISYESVVDFEDMEKILIDSVKMNIVINDFTDIKDIVTVMIDGKVLAFEEQPYIENGTTRVPMRKIFESLGAIVEYDANTKTITARKGSTVIELITGASKAKINGREMTLTTSVENKNGSTMVPLRFVSEALGAEVIWDAETKTITINLAETETDKDNLINNPLVGHSNVILTIYDDRNNILDGIKWTVANWADGAKHIINIEEEVPDVEQGKGVLASILANVPEIESEPVDTNMYTDISDLAVDGVDIIDDYFGENTKETKLLKNSIDKLGDVIDWTAFSIEEIDFILRDYKKNIQYFVLLQSNCNDEYVKAVIDDLMQDYTDKWYKTVIDVNEKIADEAVDKGIDVSAGFYTAGLYPIVKYASEAISTVSGLKNQTESLANFYQVCRMINPVDEVLENCIVKYNNGECTESELQAAFELNKATKIYAYECIAEFGKYEDKDKAYLNICDVERYTLKNGKIEYSGGSGGGNMGGR